MEDIKDAIMRMQSAIMGIQENVEKLQQGQEVLMIDVKNLGVKVFKVDGLVWGIHEKVTTLTYDVQKLPKAENAKNEQMETVYDI